MLDAVDRRAGGAQRLGRLPLRRGGQGPLEPAARRRSTRCSRCTAATSEAVEVALPRFDVGDGPGGGAMRRGVPAIRVGGRLVTTVLDLMLATYGVARDGLPGDWPEDYDDARAPYTPAWQEAITGVDRRLAVKVAREFARNAEVSGGRSMICMGAGHQPLVPLRRDLPLVHRAAAAVRLRRDQRRRLGALRRPGEDPHVRGLADARVRAGLAAPAAPGAGHVVVLPAHRAVALRPAAPGARSPRRSARGLFDGQTAIDAHAKAVRMGWMPSFPTFDRNPLDLADEAEAAGVDAGRARRVRAQGRPPELRGRRPERAVELPARVLRLALEPARLLGQGPGVLPAPPAGRRRTTVRWPSRCRRSERPSSVRWREEIPRGKLDLLVNVDFRMTTTGAVLRRRAAGGDLVREVRPVDDRHAPVRALVQPGGAAAVGGAHGLGRVPHDRAQRSRALAAEHLGVRRDVVATPVAARHARRDRAAARRGAPTGARASASRCPGARCRT